MIGALARRTSLIALLASAPCAFADDETHDRFSARGHAPIGVMGDHTHTPGEWMVSYRFMSMSMSDNRVGGDDVSPLEIVQTTPNVFNTQFNIPNQPPTVRVVPTDMTMDMHMFAGMYGLTDRITLMGMVNYVTNEMDHVVFSGGVLADDLTNDDIIGAFTTKSDGFGDTTITALIDWLETDLVRTHLTLGVSLPTGSTEETDDVLAPNGTTPTLRLPYPMQLGSGTFDPILAYTVNGQAGQIGYGVQTKAILRLYDNGDDYKLGDEYAVSVWGSYAFSNALSASVRGAFDSKGKVDGFDENIVAPVQTANPNFQGGERLDLALGVNWAGQTGTLRGHRLGAEVSAPVYQNLNGPQLKTELAFTLGWQYAF